MTVLLVDIREDRQKVARAVTERGYVAPVVLDQTGEVTEAYGIHATPTAFLIARDGTIACSRCQLSAIEEKLPDERAR